MGSGFKAVQHRIAELQNAVVMPIWQGENLPFLLVRLCTPMQHVLLPGAQHGASQCPLPNTTAQKRSCLFSEEQKCDHMEVWGLCWNFLFPVWQQFHSSRMLPVVSTFWHIPSAGRDLNLYWVFQLNRNLHVKTSIFCHLWLHGNDQICPNITFSACGVKFSFSLLFQLLNCQNEPVLCYHTEAVFGVLWECLCEWLFLTVKNCSLYLPISFAASSTANQLVVAWLHSSTSC